MGTENENTKKNSSQKDEAITDIAASFGSSDSSSDKDKRRSRRSDSKRSDSKRSDSKRSSSRTRSKSNSKSKTSEKKDKNGKRQKKETASEIERKKARKQRKKFVNEALFLMLKIGLIITAFAAALMFVVGVYRVSDRYMEPMIKSGDLVFFNRFDKNASSGDIIIVKYEGHQTASRVVAKAGDTVDIKEGSLLINGNHQFEDDIYYKTDTLVDGVSLPLTVPQGKVFVLGDEREMAVDSRMFGCVGPDEIEGKVSLVLRRREF